jgi:hypothetical protein
MCNYALAALSVSATSIPPFSSTHIFKQRTLRLPGRRDNRRAGFLPPVGERVRRCPPCCRPLRCGRGGRRQGGQLLRGVLVVPAAKNAKNVIQFTNIQLRQLLFTGNAVVRFPSDVARCRGEIILAVIASASAATESGRNPTRGNVFVNRCTVHVDHEEKQEH